MSDVFGGFDILGVGTLIGSLLFLGGLILVLWENRSFDEVSRRHAAADEQAREPAGAAPPAGPEAAAGPTPAPGTDDGSPGRPSRPKRAA